jgi:hypothetical protein
MAGVKFPYGKQVKLLADLQGFPDGRLLQFKIWRRKGQNEEKVAELYGVTKGGKGIGYWNPQPSEIGEWEEILPLKKEIDQAVEEVKFFFVASIDDKEVKSEDFTFTYLLDIYLEDVSGKPVDGAKYTVTLADGTKVQGTFKDGHVKIENAAPGKFKIELEEYEFV